MLPVELVPDPRSSYTFVAEMTGRILHVNAATRDVRVAAELADRDINSAGLRALAVHPTMMRAFVVVERPPEPTEPAHAFDSELRAYDIKSDGTFDLASEALLLRVPIPAGAHSVDTLRFGPDGMLYVSVGDGRTSEFYSPPRYDRTKLLGTMLRIDVDGAPPYAIPPDNPFVGDPTMRDEVYAYGFRNPWKFSFDRADGTLWAGDVGETRIEEVNRVIAGGNYGWPLLEGTECHPNAPGCTTAGTVLPTFSYTHATGNSLTGGYVYRGTRVPLLAGKYVYADFQAGGIWAVDLDTKGSTPIHLNAGEARPAAVAIAEDRDGELLILDWVGGGIYELAPDTPTPERPPFPQRLSATTCFVGSDPTRPAPRLVPYDVNVELWSDGASKNRFLALPPGTTLEESPNGVLALPPGGLTIKTFFEDSADGASRRPIETRFLGRQGNGEWVAASYEWNADGSDAELLVDAKELTLRSGQRWTVPAAAQCFFCHGTGVGTSLGLDRRQLDRPNHDDPSGENNLARFARLGILHGEVPKVRPLRQLDSAASLEDRARSYFHANCSMCHYAGNPALFVSLDLRKDTPFDKTNLCTVLVPGAPDESELMIRMRRRGASSTMPQMPPVATNHLDPLGSAIIADWISSRPLCWKR